MHQLRRKVISAGFDSQESFLQFSVRQLFGATTVVGLLIGLSCVIDDLSTPIAIVIVMSIVFLFVDRMRFRARNRGFADFICIKLNCILVSLASQFFVEVNPPGFMSIGYAIWPSPLLCFAVVLVSWYGDEILSNLKNLEKNSN